MSPLKWVQCPKVTGRSLQAGLSCCLQLQFGVLDAGVRAWERGSDPEPPAVTLQPLPGMTFLWKPATLKGTNAAEVSHPNSFCSPYTRHAPLVPKGIPLSRWNPAFGSPFLWILITCSLATLPRLSPARPALAHKLLPAGPELWTPLLPQEREGDPKPEEEVNPKSRAMLRPVWTFIIPLFLGRTKTLFYLGKGRLKHGGGLGWDRRAPPDCLADVQIARPAAGQERMKDVQETSGSPLVLYGVLELTRAEMYL